MLSDARNLWKAMQMLNENITTALEGFDDGTDEHERESDALKRDELDIYKKMLDDAQMQHFELSKQSRLLLAEKDAEISLLKQQNTGGKKSDLLDGLDTLKLAKEKQALEENLTRAEQELRKSLTERNEALVKMQRFDEISSHYNSLKTEYETSLASWQARDKERCDTIENLAQEYSKLASESEQRLTRSKEIEQNNEILVTKMKALEHSIGELADRASGNDPMNDNAAATELKKTRLKIVNLQFDVKEKETEISNLKKQIETFQMQGGGAQLAVGSDPKTIAANKNLLKDQAELDNLRSDIARLQAEKREIEEAGKVYFQQNRQLQKEMEGLKASSEGGAGEATVLREMLDSTRARLREAETRLVTEAETHANAIATLQERLTTAEKAASEARIGADHYKHEVTRLNEALKDAVRNAASSQAADVNAVREEMRQREERAVAALEAAVAEARREAAIAAEKATNSAVMVAVAREKSSAAAAMDALRADLNSKLVARENELLQRNQEEKAQTIAQERAVADKTMTEALAKQKEDSDLALKKALFELEQRLRTEAATAASAAAIAAASQQREAVENALRQAKTEYDAAMKVADTKVRDLEARTNELENNFKEKLDKEVAAAEVRIAAENQKSMQQMQRETRAIVQRAEQQRDEYQAMFVKENKLRKVLHNKILDMQGNIRVFCRVRPMVEVEKRSGEGIDVTEFPSEDEIVIQKDSSSKVRYEFDKVFMPGASQETVFENVKPTCLSVLDGYNVCIFAYGQTGSGKTFTMEGYGDLKGMSPRAIDEVFALIGSMTSEWSYQVTFSMLEVYNETIRDLLDNSGANREKLDVRQTAEGNVVPGLTEVQVFNPEQVMQLMADGQRNRAVGGHNMNEHSSRSHSILTLAVKGRSLKDNGQQISSGKLHLIDLAGSERVGKTDATGDRLKEAQNINKSLSALGDVIAALGSKSKSNHVPYRNSKLTFLLQDSLGGNSKVLMFVNISPVLYNVSESICSLNFAARCRNTELGQAKKNVQTGGSMSSSGSSANIQNSPGYPGQDYSAAPRASINSSGGNGMSRRVASVASFGGPSPRR